MNQINTSGIKAAQMLSGIEYWTYNWRKEGGAERMYTLAKEEEFYKQRYCGCVFSLRDTNTWHRKNNRLEIQIGKDFYNFENNS
jgi:predicted adenine nucleotide alpha hydrolase (AANH) superfamily ATPase